jgi:hypothetical protein
MSVSSVAEAAPFAGLTSDIPRSADADKLMPNLADGLARTALVRGAGADDETRGPRETNSAH